MTVFSDSCDRAGRSQLVVVLNAGSLSAPDASIVS